jgi:hypothetical protein
MTLSRRAQRMLEQGTCPAHMMERSSIVGALKRAGLPVFEPVVAFQQHFGGITYRVNGCRGRNSLGLFQPEIFGFTPDDQRYYFECFTHGTAQMGFFLGEDGTMYVDERFSSPVAIASSIEKYLESEALVNELIDLSFKWWSPLGEVAQDDTRFKERLDLPVIAQASDKYTTWWGNERVRIVQQVCWNDGPPLHWRAFYARTQSDVQQFRDSLRDLLDRRVLSLPISPWP